MIRKLKNFVHLVIALGANIFYRFPSRSMTIIGVTGTDGKTTTATLIYEILRASGKKTALLTTVSATIDGMSYDTGFHVTTPNSFVIQKYMSLAKRSGITHFVLETTSHGLDQNRVFGIRYAVSVITNISREHMDYHKTYDEYVNAKAKIIGMSDVSILNTDDISYPYLLDKWKMENGKSKIVTYGLHGDAEVSLDKYAIKPSMPGLFNTYNALAALAVCKELGVSIEQAASVIQTYETPEGRQDIIQQQPFVVMVDFAHTPNSFSALLSSLRAEYTGRIIHVFGCAGERDQGKRSEMGRISSEHSDTIVLTAEDSRNEKTEDIMSQIQEGISNEFTESEQSEQTVSNKKYLYKISDRKEAIAFALSLGRKGDIVVITGKGHEQTMNLGDGEFAWSDHEVVKKALNISS